MLAHDRKVNGAIVSVDDLTTDLRSQMYTLMETYYSNTSRIQFDKDLSEKQKVILLTDQKTGLVCGFSTQKLFSINAQEQPAYIFFSGDTIIEQKYRHSNPLASLWGRMALGLLDQIQDGELYWLLLTKGISTYRYLPVFFNTFFPCYNQATPERVRAIITAAVHSMYTSRFDSKAGVLHARQYYLKAGYADVKAERLNNPHVRFFAQRNPGYVYGDELCCLARISRDNFRSSAYRVIGAPLEGAGNTQHFPIIPSVST